LVCFQTLARDAHDCSTCGHPVRAFERRKYWSLYPAHVRDRFGDSGFGLDEFPSLEDAVDHECTHSLRPKHAQAGQKQ
jgi:hypothetical protein